MDHFLRIWDLLNNSLVIKIDFAKRFVKSLEMTSDNSRVIVSSSDGNIRIYEIESGKQLAITEGYDSSDAICLTRDQSKLVISGGGPDNQMMILDVGKMKTMTKVNNAHFEKVRCLAISPDGKMLASGSNDFEIKLWDLTTFELIKKLVGHALKVTCIQFKPESNCLVSGSADNTIRVWDLTSGIELHKKKANRAITSIGFYKDENQIFGVFSLQDPLLRIWDFKEDKFSFKFPPAPSDINCLAVMKNGSKCFGGTDKKISVYDLHDFEMLDAIEGHDKPVKALVISDISNKLFSGGMDNLIKIWDLEDNTLIATLRGHSMGINDLVVNDEGSNLFSASKDKTICMWDIQNKKKLSVFEGSEGPVESLLLTSNQKTLYSCSNEKEKNNNIRAWDLDDSSLFPFLEGHSQMINDITMTPDGKKLISVGNDRSVIIWDFQTGKQKANLKHHTAKITGVVLNCDATKFVTFSNQSNEILIWDLKTESLISSITNASPVDCLVIAPNEEFIIGCSDSVIRVIDSKTKILLENYEGHCGNVRAILLIKEPKAVISGGNDGKIMMWKSEKPDEPKIFKLKKYEGYVVSLATSEDSLRLYAGYSNGNTIMWDIAGENPIKTFHSNYKLPIKYLLTYGEHGENLIIGGEYGLEIWNIATKTSIKKYELHNKKMIVLPKLPHTFTLITCNQNNLEIRSINLVPDPAYIYDSKRTRKIYGIPNEFEAETINQANDRLIFASNDHCIYVWHLYRSICEAILEGHTEKITSLLVSKDKRVFSSSLDKKLGIWNIEKSNNITFLERHNSSVMALSFLDEEKFMISGSNDGVVLMWSLAVHQGEDPECIHEYRLEGNENIQALSVNDEKGTFYCGCVSKIIYEISYEEEKNANKILILESEIKRLLLSPKSDILIVFLASSEMLIIDTSNYTMIRKLELKKNNFRTLPVFLVTQEESKSKNTLMLYFNKLIDTLTGEVIFNFETIEEFYTFFYDPKNEVYYYISTNFQLFHFKMSFLNDFFINYLNYDSLTNFAEAEVICQRKLSVFPFFFTFLHLISIFDKDDYFTIDKLEEIYEGDVKIEYFYNVDLFLNTPLDILLLKKNSTLIVKYFELFFHYFKKETTTFAQKTRFLNYHFKPKFNILDLLKKLMLVCEEDTKFVGNLLDNAFFTIDPKVYNNTLCLEELEKPILAECENFQTINSEFLNEKLEEQKMKNKRPKNNEDDSFSKKTAIVKAKIICLPGLCDISNPITQDIFSDMSKIDHKDEIFRNQTLKIIADHIWDSQIKFYYRVELFVFMFFFLLFNINSIFIYQKRISLDLDDDSEGSFIYISIVIDILIMFYGLFGLINETLELNEFGFSKYSKSIWNWFDVFLIPLLLCSGAFDIHLVFNPESENLHVFKVVFALTMFCFWMRFISFFRAKKETSSMIRLIFTVIGAVKYFVLFMLLFMATLTATFFQLHDDDKDDPALISSTFLLFYQSTVGDSSGITNYDLVYPQMGTIFMIISTFLFAIMLLNLLVAIISDKHGEIKEAEEKTRLYELINILVDSNSSLITSIAKKIWPMRKVGSYDPYLIYIYNGKHEKKEEGDKFEDLNEKIQIKLDDVKNYYDNQMIKNRKKVSKMLKENQEKNEKMMKNYIENLNFNKGEKPFRTRLSTRLQKK